jgi:hypothetical protein
MLAELSYSTNGGRGKLEKIVLLGDNSKSKINHKTVRKWEYGNICITIAISSSKKLRCNELVIMAIFHRSLWAIT